MRTAGHLLILSVCFSLATRHQAEAADLLPATVAAFDRYVSVTEVQGDRSHACPVDRRPSGRPPAHLLTELRAGRLVVERLVTRDGGRDIAVPDGLIHHWIGTVFVAKASSAEAVRLLQDYDRHADVFAPAVQRSRIISRDGDNFTVFLRFYQKKGIAVVVNSDHTARFTRVTPAHVSSRIVSTRIQEVENPGAPDEREKPVGRDGGYLWRLNTYWRFVERDGGVYVQCESVTLTRGIPFGLGWLIGPFVTSIPRESLEFTLETTRKTLSN